MWKNLEAFIFGRTDWEYVNNTFVFPVKIGYHFIGVKNGAANGHFSGIGADEAQVCVEVEEIQPMGLLISNGEFVCMHGDIRTEVIVEPTYHGSVRLVNCAFWGGRRGRTWCRTARVSFRCQIATSARKAGKNIPGARSSRRTAASCRCAAVVSARTSPASCFAKDSSMPSSVKITV